MDHTSSPINQFSSLLRYKVAGLSLHRLQVDENKTTTSGSNNQTTQMELDSALRKAN